MSYTYPWEFNVVENKLEFPSSPPNYAQGGVVKAASEPTVVEIEFNRDFTWSEREAFRTFVVHSLSIKLTHKWLNSKRVRLTTSENFDPRTLVDLVSKFVASSYLNIHPRVAQTVSPKVEV